MVIVSGYQGVGKTTYTKTHENCLDLESSNYNKSNPNWVEEYVADILAVKDKEVLFISSHQAVRDLLDSKQVNFIFVIPHPSVQHEWTQMLADRVISSVGNEDERNKNIRALIGHIKTYTKVIAELTPHTRKHERVFYVKDVTEMRIFLEIFCRQGG